MSRPSDRAAAIVGCAGPALLAEERALFTATRPLGFILFKRNCETPGQIARLTADLRAAVEDDDAPVLIDQEGGRVRRLVGPDWHDAPAAEIFGRIPEQARGERAAWLNSRLIADDLLKVGIDVDCLPCLDLRLPQTHAVIGDRSYGAAVDDVVRLGRAAAQGLLAGGVLPVMKHLPGHGRAEVDSHLDLPRVATDRATLMRTDFAPFRALAREIALGMTGHLLFPALDAARPSTLSPTVVAEVIRGAIGFDGLLMTDDLSMEALRGTVAERAAAGIAAGCDVALHCNGRFDEMRAVLDVCGPLGEAGAARWARARQGIPGPDKFDRTAARAELASLLALARQEAP